MTSEEALPGDVAIVSMMICEGPRRVGDRLLLSASDGVWEPIVSLPAEIRALVTDDLGSHEPTYGGFLQILDRSVLEEVERRNLFACFRAVHQTNADHVGTDPNTALYSELHDELIYVGWDVCVGNGWASASYDGYFPMDSISGELEANEAQLNRWGLFSSLEDALECCALNDERIPDDSPWYPVAISVDESSYRRLANLLPS
jgi:hypothetical protein